MKALGICDSPNCNEVAYWECGQIQDEKIAKIRIARWCEKHCPKPKERKGVRRYAAPRRRRKQ